MIKVKLQKQNDKEIEFIKEIEFQVLPDKDTLITVDGNEYRIRSIKHVDSDIIMTVKDKGYRRKMYWD